jgi:hypothetical protein
MNQRGYNPSRFLRMIERHGPVEAINRLVVSPEIQSGLKELKEFDLLDRSMEETVLKFKGPYFDSDRRHILGLYGSQDRVRGDHILSRQTAASHRDPLRCHHRLLGHA